MGSPYLKAAVAAIAGVTALAVGRTTAAVALLALSVLMAAISWWTERLDPRRRRS